MINELFKIIPSSYMPDDMLIIVSSTAYMEIRNAKDMSEVLEILLKKKRLVVVRGLG